MVKMMMMRMIKMKMWDDNDREDEGDDGYHDFSKLFVYPFSIPSRIFSQKFHLNLVNCFQETLKHDLVNLQHE